MRKLNYVAMRKLWSVTLFRGKLTALTVIPVHFSIDTVYVCLCDSIASFYLFKCEYKYEKQPSVAKASI